MPSPSLAVASSSLVTAAPTVVTQGAALLIAPLTMPVLPADAATKTPASEALRKATPMGVLASQSPRSEPIEKFSTCTPSATAASMPAMMSAS